MPVVLVLGAGGFLGRHVCHALRQSPGFDVVESTRSDAGSPVRLDVAAADPTAIARLVSLARADVIVNCVGRTTGSASELTIANILTVARLLDGLGPLSVPPRLIHVGSAAEYGATDPGRPVKEDVRPAPRSTYGASKWAATQLVCLARARGTMDACVLRMFNVLGPEMPGHTLAGATIRKLIEAVRTGTSPVETGPLDPVRDFLDVRDAAAAVVAACAAPTLSSPILNVGSGVGRAARELVEELGRQVGYRGTFKEDAPGSTRSADVPWQVADIRQARDVIGWSPSYGFPATCAWVVEGELAVLADDASGARRTHPD